MKRSAFVVLLLFSLSFRGFSQTAPYVLKRSMFNPGPTSINLSPDGTLLLVGFMDGSFRVMDPESLEVTMEVKDAHTKAITALDMPPKMDFIMTAGGKSIRLWSRSGKHIGNLAGHATTIWNMDISNDGKHAVSSAFNKTFLLWDLYNGEIAEHMRGHQDVALSVAISPDNQLIASGSNDLTIRIWDLASRQMVTTLHGPTKDIFDIAFSPDSRMLAAASGERSIRVYDLKEEKLVHLLKGHRDVVKKLAFSPEGRFIVSASVDKTLILWDVVTGDKIHTFVENEDMVLDVAYAADGKSFYSISKAGDLTRWSVDPEIFVLRYFDLPYHEAVSGDTIFQPRRKGEAKKEYQDRTVRAEIMRREIIDRFYKQYLEEREQ